MFYRALWIRFWTENFEITCLSLFIGGSIFTLSWNSEKFTRINRMFKNFDQNVTQTIFIFTECALIALMQFRKNWRMFRHVAIGECRVPREPTVFGCKPKMCRNIKKKCEQMKRVQFMFKIIAKNWDYPVFHRIWLRTLIMPMRHRTRSCPTYIARVQSCINQI